jgi:hypothetical protein
MVLSPGVSRHDGQIGGERSCPARQIEKASQREQADDDHHPA